MNLEQEWPSNAPFLTGCGWLDESILRKDKGATRRYTTPCLLSNCPRRASVDPLIKTVTVDDTACLKGNILLEKPAIANRLPIESSIIIYQSSPYDYNAFRG